MKIKFFVFFLVLFSFIVLIPLVSAQTSPLWGVVCYNTVLDGSGVDFVSARFDFVDLEYSYDSTALAIHSHNGAVKVLGYKDLVYEASWMEDYATVLANPSWFVKVGADFVFNSYWGTYLMNVSDAGWQQHFIDYILTKSNFDGVFLDDVWDDVSDYQSGLNATLPEGFVSGWHDAVAGFLVHINDDYEKLIIVNSDEMESDSYLVLVDGQMIEGFVHPQWLEYGDNPVYYQSLGDDLARKLDTGRYVWCLSGVVHSTEAHDLEVLEDCYDEFAANIVGHESKAIFSFNDFVTEDGNKGFWVSVMGDVSPTVMPTVYNREAGLPAVPSFYMIILVLFAVVAILVLFYVNFQNSGDGGAGKGVMLLTILVAMVIFVVLLVGYFSG